MIPVDGFGLFPIAIELDPEAHDGPAWELIWFRHRTGWLRIVELELCFDRRTYTETRLLVCDSHDQICPSWLAGNLFRAAIVGFWPTDEEPPDLLDELEHDALVEFRRSCARENSRTLQQLEESTELSIVVVETLAMQELEILRQRLSSWRRAARMGCLAEDEVERLPAIMADLEMRMDRLVHDTAQTVSDLRRELAERADAIISAFQPMASIHHIGTAHWRFRQHRAYVRDKWWDPGEDVLNLLPSHARRTMRNAS